jgi:hypothetical protein
MQFRWAAVNDKFAPTKNINARADDEHGYGV